MEKYQLVECDNTVEFDADCFRLSKEGWFPCWPISIAYNSAGHITKYVQQWSKFEQVE